jgi:hypothetical protein
MPALVNTDSVRVDVLEHDVFETRLASAFSEALEFVQARSYEAGRLQVDFRVRHRLPEPIEIEILMERGGTAVTLSITKVDAGSAGLFTTEGSLAGIQADSLNLVLRLYRSNRRSEAKRAVLPDREFRFANCAIQRPKRRAAPRMRITHATGARVSPAVRRAR